MSGRSAARVAVTAGTLVIGLAGATASQAAPNNTPGDGGGQVVSLTRTPLGANLSDQLPTVGRIYLTFPNGSGAACSGNLIQAANRDVVATAGHCLYAPQQGGYATSVRFIMGYGSVSHQTEFPVRTWQIVPGYVTAVDSGSTGPNHDTAFVVLGANGIGQHAGDLVFPTPPRFDSAGTGYRNGYGYPGTGNQLASCGGVLAPDVEGYPATMACSEVLTSGSSGGPMISSDGYQDGDLSRGAQASSTERRLDGTEITTPTSPAVFELWDGTTYGTYDWAQHQ
jgi:V8-like Glu-specific endopeptidase